MKIARQQRLDDRRANVVARSQRPVSHKPCEQGYAMLVVMLMAAAIAYSLYMQVPRYAFETMRQREQLLMDRGNQYKRAIQVYYADNKHYPAKLDDLEKTNDKRYLRRRYKDPLTGSDEWRLIHTNGSVLTDSLVQKPTQNAANGTPGAGALPGAGPLGANVMNTTSGPFGAGGTAFPGGQPGAPGLPGAGNNNGQPDPTPVNAAVLRRPSDRLTAAMPTPTPGLPQNIGQDNGLVPGLYPPGYNPAAYNPNDPSTWPPITLATANPQTGQPGQFPGQNGQQPAFPGMVTPGVANTGGVPNQGVNQGAQNGQQPVTIPGFGPQNSLNPQQVTQVTSAFPDPSQAGVVQTPLPFGPQPVPGNAGNPLNETIQANTLQPTGIPGQGAGLGGQNPQIFNPAFGFAGNPLAPDAAAQAGIQQGLTPASLNPAVQAIGAQLASPTGAPAAPLTNSQMQNSPQMAPGIAGVASKFEGASIKVYNKRSKYKEWEFVFDPSTQTTGTQTAAGQATPGQPGLQNGQTNNGTNTGGFNIPGFSSGPGQTPQPGLPQTGQQPGQLNSTPSTSPFGQSPFGQPTNPFGAPAQ